MEVYPTPKDLDNCDSISANVIDEPTKSNTKRKRTLSKRAEEALENANKKKRGIHDEQKETTSTSISKISSTCAEDINEISCSEPSVDSLQSNLPPTESCGPFTLLLHGDVNDYLSHTYENPDHSTVDVETMSKHLNMQNEPLYNQYESVCALGDSCYVNDKNVQLHSCSRSTCKHLIHHICSDSLGSPEGKYFCSVRCLQNIVDSGQYLLQDRNTANSDNSSKIEGADMLDSDFDMDSGSEEEAIEPNVFDCDEKDDGNSNEEISIPQASVDDKRITELLKPQNLRNLSFLDSSMPRPSLFQGSPSIKQNLMSLQEPIDIFFKLFPLHLIQTIANKSNLYKNENGGGSIRDFSVEEIVKFIGLLIANAVLPWTCGVTRNWKTTGNGPFPNGLWGNYLTKTRYQEISRYLHFNDNNNMNINDKFDKIRIVLDTLNQTFNEAYNLGKNCSFDEGTWATKSKYCPSKQFNPNKPHKWGLKVFMLCCSETGFCTRFEVYQGKQSNQLNTDLAAGPHALYRNVKHLSGTKRVIFCDRYYTSVSLFIRLLEIGLYAVGTTKKNVCGYPKSVSLEKTSSRGTLISKVADIYEYGNITALCWMDSKPVHVLSTAYPSIPTTIVRRIKRGERKTFNCCLPINMYQRCMGGVDLNDFLRMAMYSIQSHSRFRKWYKMCFSASLDLAVTNSFILWKSLNPMLKMSHGQFMEKLSIQLLNFRYQLPGLTISRPITAINHHKICKYDNGAGHSGQYRNQKVCFVCKNKRSSAYYCETCGVTVCIKLRESIGMTCADYIHTDPATIEKIRRRSCRITQREELESQYDKRARQRKQKEAQRVRKMLSPQPKAIKK